MPIPLDLRTMNHKGQSVGSSEGFRHQRPVTVDDLLLQGKALLYVGDHLLGGHNLPELMPFVSLVHEAEVFGTDMQELVNVLIFDQRFPDVVNLKAHVLSVSILNEKDARDWNAARGNIKKFPSRSLPNSVKLGLDVNLWSFPDSPAQYAPSAMFCNARINDREAFILRRAIGR